MNNENYDKLLTICYFGKNDDYCNDFKQRISLTIQKQINNIRELNISDDIEILLLDWGSDEDDDLLNSMNLDISGVDFRCVYVPYETCDKYKPMPSYSHVHALNTGIRNSNGKYVLISDAECYMRIEDTKELKSFVDNYKNDDIFYWGSMHHIPSDIYIDFTNTDDVDKYIEKEFYNIRYDKIDTNNFHGYAGLLLGNREIFNDCQGFYEKLTHAGWLDTEIHYRLIQKYVCGGNLSDYGIDVCHMLHNEFLIKGYKVNNRIKPSSFKANGENWGLENEKLIITDYKKTIKNGVH